MCLEFLRGAFVEVGSEMVGMVVSVWALEAGLLVLVLPLSKWDAWEDVLDVMESKEAVRVIANISIWLILRLDGTPVEIDRGMIELAYAAIFRSRWGIACHAL